MYLYAFNHTKDEEQLCKMELKYLFNSSVDDERRYFFSEKYIEENRSPFINFRIDVKMLGDSLEDLINKIRFMKINYKNYKVKYMNIDKKMEYDERIHIEKVVGEEIEGNAKMHNPDVIVAASYIEGKWILGELYRNKNPWHDHNMKPYQYCNAITAKMSRSIVNIAVSNLEKPMLVDPCCGIGTVVIEALSMGFNIKGFDINSNIVERARYNLDFLGYDDVISCSDISNLDSGYDAAIVDLPYGILSPTTKEIQMNIIRSSRRIADRVVILSSFDMKEDFKKAGFIIEDECHLNKGRKFTRYITLCKK